MVFTSVAQLRGLASKAAAAAALALLAASPASAVPGSTSFRVAEVKPHFQCTDAEGQDRVKQYVSNLTSSRTGIIALIQFEFAMEQPEGYMAFGAACVSKHSDSTVVLVDTMQFDLVRGIRDTITGDYNSMPYLTTGTDPKEGNMCVSNVTLFGERAYTAAVLKHKSSGEEVCVVSGTWPHCGGAWQSQFVEDLTSTTGCGARPVLFVVDSNAGCPTEGPEGSKIPVLDLAANQSVSFSHCSDPAFGAGPTCCHDIAQGMPEARFWYDRTALCNGVGEVTDFSISKEFVCGDNEEHKYTVSTVELGEASTVAYV